VRSSGEDREERQWTEKIVKEAKRDEESRGTPVPVLPAADPEMVSRRREDRNISIVVARERVLAKRKERKRTPCCRGVSTGGTGMVAQESGRGVDREGVHSGCCPIDSIKSSEWRVFSSGGQSRRFLELTTEGILNQGDSLPQVPLDSLFPLTKAPGGGGR
jgi:hypothetical protein